RTPGIRSVTTRRPELNPVRVIAMDDSGVLASLAVAEPPAVPLAAVPAVAAITAAPPVPTSTRPICCLDDGSFRDVPLGPDGLQADLALRIDILAQHGEGIAPLDRPPNVGL